DVLGSPHRDGHRALAVARPSIVGIIAKGGTQTGPHVVISLPSVLRTCRAACVLRLATLAAAAAFLIVATAALAPERYRTPDEAVAALVDALRTDELQQLTRVLGPGSDEIVRSGDPVDDAAARKRFLDAFDATHQILPDGEDQVALIVGEERWP